MRIKIERGTYYGKNENNFTCIDINDTEFYFSYDTVVAFRNTRGELRVIKNYWGTTTGKHLNYICPDHDSRLDRGQFEQELNKLLETM
jgi:hypothetical protein